MTSNKSQTISSKLHFANKMSELLSATMKSIDHDILCVHFKLIVYETYWIVKKDRFNSILRQEDAYLLELFRCIHLNLLRAGIVKDMGDLDKSPWSGHSALSGGIERPWQDTENRFIRASKELTIHMMKTIETLGVYAIDVAHAPGEVGVRGLNEEVVMIAEQAKSRNPHMP